MLNKQCQNKRWSFLFTQKLMNPHLEYCVQFRMHQYERDMHTLQRVHQRTTRMVKGTDCPWGGKAEKDRTVQCEQGSGGKLSINVYKYLREGCKVVETGSLQWSPVTGSGGSWHRRFCLSFREHIFAMHMTEYQNRMPREVKQSPSLQILTNYLDTVLSNRLWVVPLEWRSCWTMWPPEVASNLSQSMILCFATTFKKFLWCFTHFLLDLFFY